MTAKLAGITWDHPRGLGGLLSASSQWSRLHPGVEVSWSARSLHDFGDAPIEPLAARYDLVVVDHPHIPCAAATGCLLALDAAGHDAELACLERDSVGASHRSYAYASRQWAVAIDAAAQVAVYRPDRLGRPPGSWEEVLELARAGGPRRASSGAPGERASGRVLWPAKPVDAFSSFCTLAANQGTPVAGSEQFVAREDGLAVLEMLHRLAEAVPQWCLDADPIQVADMLASPDGSCYSPLGFGYVNYSRAGFRPARLAYVDMPAGRCGVTGSCLGGAGLAVSASSSHPDEAIAFAFWVAGSHCQAGPYYWGGGQPANSVAWDDDAINDDSIGFFRSSRATLQHAWVRPAYQAWRTFQIQAAELIHRALRRDLGDGDTLTGIDALWEKTMGQDRG